MSGNTHSVHDKQPPAQSRASLVHTWISRPAPFILPFFGFAFSRAANDLLTYRFASVDTFGPLWGEDIYSLAMLVAFLLCALFARRIAPLFEHTAVVRTAACLALVAALVSFIAPFAGTFSMTLLVAAMAAGGVAGALFILLWAEFHSCLDPLRIVLYISGAFLLGSTAAWLLQDLDSLRSTFILMLFPLLSVWCLKKSFSQMARTDLPRSVWGRYKFPWKLIVVLGVYELTYGVWEAQPTFMWETYTLGVIGVALVVFMLACFFSRRLDFAVMYRTPFVLMLCGLVMAPLTATLGGFVSDLAVSAGYALMFLMLTCLLCDLSHRFGISVLVLCGVQELAAVFRLGGHRIPDLLEQGLLPSFVDGAFISTTLTIAVVVASVALLFGKELSGTWGASFFGVGKMAVASENHGRLTERCAELSALHGLSPRECEVFELLAQGMSPAAIERELVIANGTLKSHTRRIYQKLGIHTKRELQLMVGEDIPSKAKG